MIRARVDWAGAEEVAVAALTFLTGDEERLRRFLDVTGLRPDTIRSAAASGRFLASVLDYVMSDEALLVAFARERGLEPEAIGAAHRILSPEESDP